MALTTSTVNTRGLLVDSVAALLVQPTINQAIAGSTATVLTISTNSVRIPIVKSDPSAGWVAEGAEIPLSDAVLDELEVVPSKLAALTKITSELANDSTPQAAQVVGDGQARDLARRLDAAFFGALAAPAPAGLGGLSGVQTVVATGAFTNLDAFSEAIAAAENVGATITSFAMGPATALSMAKVRDETGSNRPLLGADGTAATQRMIRGVPVFVSAAIPPNVCWAIDSSRTWLVVRDNATIEVDKSVYFSSDSVAVRGTMRVGFGFPHAASTVKISTI